MRLGRDVVGDAMLASGWRRCSLWVIESLDRPMFLPLSRGAA
jgi:hypothetical protein